MLPESTIPQIRRRWQS